ncbi:unnamed protein product [Rotaria socialis]|uniref:Uncharacterized protein n=1 Tax=Rotaria socialis TaxID=392032 RepID=A0A820ZRH0_9BILA|nr:unnamed protein product [Rotaria socialis]CAF4567186.1 unnamed protein product [Rotaria socialis]
MNPLSDTCDAFASIDNILQKRKKTMGNSFIESTAMEKLTEDNFHYAHLHNRSIDQLPNLNTDDVEQLKSFNICTMQDLLGRFLIHDTAEEYYSFLIKSFQLSEKTALAITKLFHQWTKYNIDATIDNNKY